MNVMFSNRAAAGRLLAEKLSAYAARPGVIVLAVPHGGVPVGAEVAQRWHVPLDVLEVRKLGAPAAVAHSSALRSASDPVVLSRSLRSVGALGMATRRETLPTRRGSIRRRGIQVEITGTMESYSPAFGLGAVASGDFRVLNPVALNTAGLKTEVIESAAVRELKQLHHWERIHRHGRPALALRGRLVILVDDVIVSGSTMRVAVAALRAAKVGPIILASPVAARESYLELRSSVQGFVALCMPRDFGRIGHYYTEFEPISDAEVRRLLDFTWSENIAVTSGLGAS